MTRRVLPHRRASETFTLRFWNQNFTITIGRFPDGVIGEVFIDGGKSGQDIQSTARDAAVMLSLALQHGTRSRRSGTLSRATAPVRLHRSWGRPSIAWQWFPSGLRGVGHDRQRRTRSARYRDKQAPASFTCLGP